MPGRLPAIREQKHRYPVVNMPNKNPLLYNLSRGLLRLGFRLLGGIHAIGLENVPKSGGVILAPNHVSYADPPAAGCCIDRQVHFMAKEELFRVPLLRGWMYRVGTFPVRRGTADRKALRKAVELLNEGRIVCIFPEGTRSKDGRLKEAELGIGLIALKSRAPVVPVAILGTDRIFAGGRKIPRRSRITVIYGQPLTFDDLTDESRASTVEVGRRVMDAISKLLSTHAG